MGLDSLASWTFWIASLGAFLVGLSKGGLPAIGMLAVPILALVMPPLEAALLLLPIFIASDVVSVWLYRRSFSAVNLKILVPAGLLGIGVGWATASLVSERVIAFLIGLMGVAFCLQAWLRARGTQTPPRAPHRGWGSVWGAVAGFTSFISHSGAPPFQVYMLPQRLPRLEFAGTATLFFAMINLAKILPYQALQPYTLASLQAAAGLIPAALVGTVVGAMLTRRMDDQWFYRLVQWGLLAVSMKLMVDAVVG